MSDIHFMKIALRLARRGLGTVWPNPAVGCVLVKNNQIIATGWTQAGGRPHAEAHALSKTQNTQGATAYVTLEPCAHHGKTPPCAHALINAGIEHVIIGCTDPDPRVAGKGIEILKNAGIKVTTSVLENECVNINQGFFNRITQDRPFVTLKLATSADYKIAWPNNTPRWVTEKHARQTGHFLRHTHDAIMVGIGTVLTDDPMLTCRLPGLSQPVRVVLDSSARLPKDSKLATSTDQASVWVLGGKNPNLTDVTYFKANKNPRNILKTLAEQGITRLLIEGGAGVATSFLGNNLVDQIYHFQSPDMIGTAGVPALNNISFEKALDGFAAKVEKPCGRDMLTIYTKA